MHPPPPADRAQGRSSSARRRAPTATQVGTKTFAARDDVTAIRPAPHDAGSGPRDLDAPHRVEASGRDVVAGAGAGRPIRAALRESDAAAIEALEAPRVETRRRLVEASCASGRVRWATGALTVAAFFLADRRRNPQAAAAAPPTSTRAGRGPRRRGADRDGSGRAATAPARRADARGLRDGAADERAQLAAPRRRHARRRRRRGARRVSRARRRRARPSRGRLLVPSDGRVEGRDRDAPRRRPRNAARGFYRARTPSIRDAASLRERRPWRWPESPGVW